MIEKGLKIEIPPHGYVVYVDHLGSDQRIVDAARVSYLGSSKGEEQDRKLLNYLFKNRHTSPFEQCSITYVIKMPIFVMRQFVRHRTFRLNEWSGRYSELKEEFFFPDAGWRVQDSANKQGSLPYNDADGRQDWNNCNNTIAERAYEAAYGSYMDLLKRGVAKELARVVLPVGVYTEIMINADLHNLMHFFRLRTDSHAQKEIQDIAWAMLTIAKKLFPWTIAAYDRYRIETQEFQPPASSPVMSTRPEL